MPVNVTEISRGDILELNGDPWQVSEISSQTPSAPLSPNGTNVYRGRRSGVNR